MHTPVYTTFAHKHLFTHVESRNKNVVLITPFVLLLEIVSFLYSRKLEGKCLVKLGGDAVYRNHPDLIYGERVLSSIYVYVYITKIYVYIAHLHGDQFIILSHYMYICK